MTASNLLPAWAGLSSLVLIVNNSLSYSGMEMNAVHVGSLKEPGKEFPKAIFLAMGLVLLRCGPRARTARAIPVLQVPQAFVEAAGAGGGDLAMSTVEETSTQKDRRVVYIVSRSRWYCC